MMPGLITLTVKCSTLFMAEKFLKFGFLILMINHHKSYVFHNFNRI